MTDEQFAELKALLLITNALLLKVISGYRPDNYPDLWDVVGRNFQRILSQLEAGKRIQHLPDVEVGSE